MKITGHSLSSYATTNSWSGDIYGNIHFTTGTAGQPYDTFSGRVQLPDGAVVVGFSARVFDDHPLYMVNPRLYRVENEDTAEPMASIASVGQLGNWRTISSDSIQYPTVNNSNEYVVIVYLSGAATDKTKFNNVEITYEYLFRHNRQSLLNIRSLVHQHTLSRIIVIEVSDYPLY